LRRLLQRRDAGALQSHQQPIEVRIVSTRFYDPAGMRRRRAVAVESSPDLCETETKHHVRQVHGGLPR